MNRDAKKRISSVARKAILIGGGMHERYLYSRVKETRRFDQKSIDSNGTKSECNAIARTMEMNNNIVKALQIQYVLVNDMDYARLSQQFESIRNLPSLGIRDRFIVHP